MPTAYTSFPIHIVAPQYVTPPSCIHSIPYPSSSHTHLQSKVVGGHCKRPHLFRSHSQDVVEWVIDNQDGHILAHQGDVQDVVEHVVTTIDGVGFIGAIKQV